jgi:hypothetical protein
MSSARCEAETVQREQSLADVVGLQAGGLGQQGDGLARRAEGAAHGGQSPEGAGELVSRPEGSPGGDRLLERGHRRLERVGRPLRALPLCLGGELFGGDPATVILSRRPDVECQAIRFGLVSRSQREVEAIGTGGVRDPLEHDTFGAIEIGRVDDHAAARIGHPAIEIDRPLSDREPCQLTAADLDDIGLRLVRRDLMTDRHARVDSTGGVGLRSEQDGEHHCRRPKPREHANYVLHRPRPARRSFLG